MAELLAGLDHTLAARTQFFLLAGEAGIGKTRIAREVAFRAENRGVRVVWGSSWEGNGAPAYWPLIRVARVLIGQSGADAMLSNLGAGTHDLARLIGAQSADGATSDEPERSQARFRLFDSFAALLKNSARAEPLLVILDDLHCAGQAAWSMVQFVAGELRDAPLMMIITCRDGEIRQSSRFSKVVSELLRSARQLSLSGLGEDEVAQFVESSSGHVPSPALAGTLHRRTAGNPFFLGEVVRALMAHGDLAQSERNPRWVLAIPDSVRTSIRGRIALLPPRAGRLLSAAAVMGNRFELAPIQRVCELSNEQSLRILDAAVNAGIVARLAGAPATYRFCHALVQEALYEGLETGERLRIHQTLVGILEDLYRAEPHLHLDELAYHSVAAAEAGNADKAIDYAVRAGEAAYAAFAYEQAAHHWQAALRLMEHGGCEPAALARMLERLGDAFSITEFDHPKGIEALERAALIYENADRRVEGAGARARLAVMLSTRVPAPDIPRALEQYRLAERVLCHQPDSESQVWLYNGLAQAAYESHRLEEGLAASQRAMEMAERLGRAGLWARAAATRSDLLFDCGRLAEASALADEAWHKADRSNDLRGAFESAWNGAYHPMALWDPRDAQRWLTRELSRPRLAQAAYQSRILRQQMAFTHVFRGNLAEARRLLSHSPRPTVHGFLLLFEGDLERADSILDQGRETMRTAGSFDGELVYSFLQELVCRANGDLARAQSLMERMLELSLAGPVLPFELNARAEMAFLAIIGGETEKAASHLPRCRQILAGGEDYRGISGRVALAEAVVAAGLGDHASAARYFSRALEILVRYDLPWEQAQAWEFWGNAMLAQGERAGASERFDAALGLYRRHGAGAIWVQRATAMRQRCDVATSPVPSAGVSASIAQARGPDDAAGCADGLFLREGDYFTISFNDSIVRLKSTKGLCYLACLLARPGLHVPADELARIVAGSKMKARARRSDRRRSRAEESRAAERSRVMVTKGIKAAIARIRGANPSLGRLLALTVRTGRACIYEPDPEHPIPWRVRK